MAATTSAIILSMLVAEQGPDSASNSNLVGTSFWHNRLIASSNSFFNSSGDVSASALFKMLSIVSILCSCTTAEVSV